MNDTDRINALERKLEDLISRLSSTEHELTLRIDDAKSDCEREIDSVRDDVKTLEHKVDFG